MKPTLVQDMAGALKVWDHPRDGMDYVIGIDSAENKRRDRSAIERRTKLIYADQRPDYSAAVVLETLSGLHVATWHGYCPPDEFSTIVAALGFYYNTAFLVPEINGPGFALVTRLSETIRYPNIYRSTAFNVMDRDPLAPSWGFRTDAHTRPILITRVHEVVNSSQLWTRDAELVSELRTMEFDDAGVPRARGRNKDDRVFALALALQGRHQSINQTGGLNAGVAKSPTTYEGRIWQQVNDRVENGSYRHRSPMPGWSRGSRLGVAGRKPRR